MIIIGTSLKPVFETLGLELLGKEMACLMTLSVREINGMSNDIVSSKAESRAMI